jgi:hypothetical protein
MRLRYITGMAALAVSAAVYAQAVKSSFVGTVRDPSGAVVAHAKITVTNLETNVSTTALTNQNGEYIAPFLDSGRYSVSAEMAGFATEIESNIKLDVAANMRVDFTLKVGTTTEKVEIRGASPLVETDTSGLGPVITTEKLEQLPLLGRNYQQLSQIAPMAVSPAGNQGVPNFTSGGLTAGTYYQVAGQRGSYMSYMVDGLDNNNIAWQTIGILPSLDAIGELKVQDHNFSAEYGRGTVQYLTTTKQGTNQPHGSVYEYVRNNVFNANSFINNRAHVAKAAFRYNQFGATFGGPVTIPKVHNGKDRTFFFFGYEGTRYVSNSTAFATWPNPAWLTGDFSSQLNTNGSQRVIYDPITTQANGSGGYTRDPFPGNRIPVNKIDPVAKVLSQFIPQPGSLTGGAILPSGSNTVVATPVRTSPNNYVGRVDHSFSDNDRFYARYMESLETQTTAGIAPLTGTIGVHNGYNVMVAETHVFSPTLFNEIRLGYNRSNITTSQEGGAAGCIGPCPADTNIVKLSGLQNLVGGTNPLDYGLANLAWTGYSTIGGAVSRPLIALTNTYQISDNLVKMHGRHTFKAGLSWNRTRFNFTSETYARGGFTFTGQFTQGTATGQAASTGSSIADFMLGVPAVSNGLAGDSSGPFRTGYQGYYFQDDWRVSSRLTLNLGLRWEYYAPFTALADNENAQFHFGSIPGSCFGSGCPPGYIQMFGKGQEFYARNLNDWAPRVGFAYTPFGDNKTVIRGSYGIFYSPTDSTDSGTWGLTNPPVSLTFTLTPNNPFTDVTTTKFSNLFPTGKLPPISQLRTDIWPIPGLALMTDTIGVAKDAGVQQWQFTIQRAMMSNLLVELGYAGSHGVHGSRLIDDNQARLDAPGAVTPLTSRLPYPTLSSQLTVMEHSASNKYEAGFLRVERRFGGGLSFLSSLTWARTEEDYGNKNGAGHWWAQNAYDKKSEFGLSAYDAKLRFTTGFVWQLPFGRGRRFGSAMHPVVDAVAGGWQVSGVTTFQTGSPLFALTNKDWSNTGILNGPAGGGRPNCIAPVQYMDPRQTGLWFNPSAFAVPTLGSFGNCGTGVMYGPGVNNWDLSASKSFRIREHVTLQFRSEMFNAFNHTQFTFPSGNFTIDPSLSVQQQASVPNTLSPRNIQFAVRLQF